MFIENFDIAYEDFRIRGEIKYNSDTKKQISCEGAKSLLCPAIAILLDDSFAVLPIELTSKSDLIFAQINMTGSDSELAKDGISVCGIEVYDVTVAPDKNGNASAAPVDTAVSNLEIKPYAKKFSVQIPSFEEIFQNTSVPFSKIKSGTNSISNDNWRCECSSVNNSNFCPNCGKKRLMSSKSCKKCGGVLPAAANYCPICGESVDKTISREQ